MNPRHAIPLGIVICLALGACQQVVQHPADMLTGPPSIFAPPQIITPDGAPYVIVDGGPAAGVAQTLGGPAPNAPIPPVVVDPAFNQPLAPSVPGVALPGSPGLPYAVPDGPAPGTLGWPLNGPSLSPIFGLPEGPELAGALPNPLTVPVTDDEFAWEQLADVVSNYFPIAGEQRARRFGEIMVEGHIVTAYQDGATILEPHRDDSVGEFNLWESTLQTIRRRALVQVKPAGPGYLVHVEVQKELEDLARPERATAGIATFRTDGALPSRIEEDVSTTQSSTRWIALGRDIALEQQMLADIGQRLAAQQVVLP